jgi:hypothetical protein
MRSDGVDDPATEAGNSVGRRAASKVRIAPKLNRHEIKPRIEPHNKLRPLPLNSRRNAIAEVRSHRRSLNLHVPTVARTADGKANGP